MDLSNLSNLQGNSLSPELLASLAAALQSGSTPTELLNQLLHTTQTTTTQVPEEVPQPVEAVPEEVAPQPVEAVPEVVAPQPVAAVPEVVAPQPVAAVPEVAVPQPVAVPEEVAPQPVEAVPEVVAPQPVAVPEVVAPQPVAVPEEVAPQPVAAVPEVVAPQPVAAVPQPQPAPPIQRLPKNVVGANQTKLSIEEIQNLKKSVLSYQSEREQRLLKLLEYKKIKNNKLAQEAKLNAEWPLAARVSPLTRKVPAPVARESPYSAKAQSILSKNSYRDVDRERQMLNKKQSPTVLNHRSSPVIKNVPVEKLVRPLLMVSAEKTQTVVPVLPVHTPMLVDPGNLPKTQSTYREPTILRLNSLRRTLSVAPSTAAPAPTPRVAAPAPTPRVAAPAPTPRVAAPAPAPRPGSYQGPAFEPVSLQESTSVKPLDHRLAIAQAASRTAAQASAAPASERPKTAVDLLAARNRSKKNVVDARNVSELTEKLAQRDAAHQARRSLATEQSLLTQRAEAIRQLLKKK